MLTEESYQFAVMVYCAAAVVAIGLFNLWMLRGQSLRLRLLLSLPLAAILLTPALIEPGAETLAPALIVAAFQFLTHGAETGPEMAEHALKPLLLFTGVAVGIGCLSCIIFRPRKVKS